MKDRWAVVVLVVVVLILMPSMALANTPTMAPTAAKVPTFAQERNIARDLYDVDALSQSVRRQNAHSLECYLLIGAGWLYALGGKGSNAMAVAIFVCNAQG
jgi:hypothetical protein